VTALFVIFGKLFGATIDTLFMTAMLAILGYSVNDTIIIFNRLKEDWLTSRRGDLVTIMDQAARATMVRSLNTSITTLLVLSTLLIFGGETIRWFIVALAAGVLVGTYSSIFVAPSVLHMLAKRT
jgi:preprotein translocase subunit SecF